MPAPPYRWNAKAYSYVDPRTGRFVSSRTVRDSVDAALKGATTETRSLSERLRAGKINLAEWQLGMAKLIRAVHGYSAALAKGGFAQMGPADWGRVGATVKRQYRFIDEQGKPRGLRVFAEEIASGKQKLDGKLLMRAQMYMEAARGESFHATERREREIRGFTEERSVLHPADHCEGAGSCTEQEAKGWQKIGTMIPIGRRLCRTKCRCTVEYR